METCFPRVDLLPGTKYTAPFLLGDVGFLGMDSSAGGVPRGLSAGSRLRRQTEIGRIHRGTGQASSPGDFGLLDIPLVSGSDSTRDLLEDKEFGESGATTKTAHEAKFSMLVPYILFMLCGQSMSFSWYGISNAVPYFSSLYGDGAYRNLLLIYNAPALFLLIFQTRYDVEFDQKYGSRKAYSVRLVSAIIVLCICTILLAYLKPSFLGMAFITGIVGIFDSVGYEALSQMCGRFGGLSSTFLFIGQSVTSFWQVAFTEGAQLADNFTDGSLITGYFWFVTAGCLLGGVSFLFLLRTKAAEFCLADTSSSSTQTLSGTKFTIMEAARRTWSLQLASIVLWFSVAMVQGLIGSYPSSSSSPTSLAQFMIYIQLFGAFTGKSIAIFRRGRFISTPVRLMISCMILLPVSTLFVLYGVGKLGFTSDGLLLAFFSLFRITSAYFSALIYIMLDCDAEMLPQACSLLNVTCFVGVIFALSLTYAFAQ